MKSNEDAEEHSEIGTSFRTNEFFQAIIERRIADAEKELDAVRSTIPGTDIGRGYLKGLEGLLLTAKSNDDKYLYLSRIEKTQKKLKELRKEFTNHEANVLHTEYDKGYFRALESYIRKLEHLDLSQEQPSEHKE